MRSDINGLMIADVALAVDGYNYYGFVSSGEDSRYIVMRENVAETEYRYAFGIGNGYSSAWTVKATLAYILPNQLRGKN